MKRGSSNTLRCKQAIGAVNAADASATTCNQDAGDAMGVSVTGPFAQDGHKQVSPPSLGSFSPTPEDKGETRAVDVDGDPVGSVLPGGLDPASAVKAATIDVENTDTGDGDGDGDDNADPFPFSSFSPPGPGMGFRPFPRRRGCGRDPDEDVLHAVPSSHGGPHRKRCIFREWPRDPNGKPIATTAGHGGTMSPDGYPWGATLYDFYAVHKVPGVPGVVSYMTGSALAQEMAASGELDAAAQEMLWARSEGVPRDEGVADTEDLVRSVEDRTRVALGLGERAGQDDKEDEKIEKNKGRRGPKDTVHHVSVPPPLTIPVTSPFHPSHYPKPWPLCPFQTPDMTVLLQERIPLHLLPRMLYVHDPFNLLAACDKRFCNTRWDSQPDVVRTYKQVLFDSGRSRAVETREKAEELKDFKAGTLVFLRYKRSKEQIENFEPIIEVPLPPYRPRPMKTEEAHLYISPVARVGDGHHSVVYKGELELPRDLFVRPTLCPQCFKESVDKEIQRLKDTGRWQKMMSAAAWGPTGFTGRPPTAAELEAVSDPINLEVDGETIERELTFILPPGASPTPVLNLINEEGGIWDMLMKNEDKTSAIFDLTSPSEDDVTDGSYIATIRINPPFTYESQKNCTHQCRFDALPHPRTTKFTVIAKLSFEHDSHLTKEARNYQEFPEHFFHHYNGYTILPQLRAVVPVRAIVPQYYGYYRPQMEEGENRKGDAYLSPILLLEHCGKEIKPYKLSTEDQEECVSMMLRFQRAGWLHGSVWPRNFLVQEGLPTEFPAQRLIRPELSFRLIDFGRSKRYTEVLEKRSEEAVTLYIFERLIGRMAMTVE